MGSEESPPHTAHHLLPVTDEKNARIETQSAKEVKKSKAVKLCFT